MALFLFGFCLEVEEPVSLRSFHGEEFTHQILLTFFLSSCIKHF